MKVTSSWLSCVLSALCFVDVVGLKLLYEPDYESEWTSVVVQSVLGQSRKVFYHGLGELPIYVQLLVRADQGTNAGFIFEGTGSQMTDNDNGQPYGGIMYFYDETSVLVMPPLHSQNTYVGRAICVGGNGWTSSGGNSQCSGSDSLTAEVKVKAWKESTFPAADEEHWTYMKAKDDSFKEVSHSLGTTPEFAIVQARAKTPTSFYVGTPQEAYVAQGVGAVQSSTGQKGGVVFGFDASKVRLWACSDTRFLIHVEDGWDGDYYSEDGDVRVLLFKKFADDSALAYITNITLGPAAGQAEKTYLDPALTFTSDSFVVVQTEATDGVNSGYRFNALGSVQNQRSVDDYGGLVYGYNPDLSVIRFWRPDTASQSKGNIIQISSQWGAGSYTQASASAKVLVRVWQIVKKCDTVDPYQQVAGTFDGSHGSDMSLVHPTPLGTQTVTSDLRCSWLCVVTKDCRSFNFKRDANNEGGHDCELFSHKKNHFPAYYKGRQGYTYYESTNCPDYN